MASTWSTSSPKKSSQKRPRTLGKGDDETQPKLTRICTDVSSMEDALECPYCMNICIPPIFMCETGHQICNNCVRVYNNCPTCKLPVGWTRNLFMENYFEHKCFFACPHSGDGCGQMDLSGKDVKAHENICDFRPLTCFNLDSKCPKGTRIPYSKYLDHLKGVHKVKFLSFVPDYLVGMAGVDSIDLYQVEPMALQVHGATFLVEAKVQNYLLNSWVLIFGGEKEADRFHVRITVGSGPLGKGFKRPIYSHSWEGPILPIRTEEETIIDQGKCFALTLKSLIHLSNKGRLLGTDLEAYRFFIKWEILPEEKKNG